MNATTDGTGLSAAQRRQRIKAFVRMDWRTLLAFVVSPFAGPALVHFADSMNSGQSFFALHILVAAIAGACCLCISLFVALPLFLMLRRLVRVSLFCCVVSGALVGALIPLAFGASIDGDFWVGGASYGVAVSSIFWLIGVRWPRQRRASPCLASTT